MQLLGRDIHVENTKFSGILIIKLLFFLDNLNRNVIYSV